MATSNNAIIGNQETYEKVCDFFNVKPSDDVMYVTITIEPNSIVTMTETRPLYFKEAE